MVEEYLYHHEHPREQDFWGQLYGIQVIQEYRFDFTNSIRFLFCQKSYNENPVLRDDGFQHCSIITTSNPFVKNATLNKINLEDYELKLRNRDIDDTQDELTSSIDEHDNEHEIEHDNEHEIEHDNEHEIEREIDVY